MVFFKRTVLGLFFSSIISLQQIFGMDFYHNNLERNFISENSSKKEFSETPLRRADTIFFLAFPFVMVTGFFAVGVMYYISDYSHASFDIKKYPPALNQFLVASALVASGTIVYVDYQNEKEKVNDRAAVSEEKKKELRSSYYLKFIKRF